MWLRKNVDLIALVISCVALVHSYFSTQQQNEIAKKTYAYEVSKTNANISGMLIPVPSSYFELQSVSKNEVFFVVEYEWIINNSGGQADYISSINLLTASLDNHVFTLKCSQQCELTAFREGVALDYPLVVNSNEVIKFRVSIPYQISISSDIELQELIGKKINLPSFDSIESAEELEINAMILKDKVQSQAGYVIQINLHKTGAPLRYSLGKFGDGSFINIPTNLVENEI
ncbi:hypothetical protein VFMJ11_A0674 [Aliivibrio fischeri MJ11]|uniref:Uncharacterized protein n=2 Tax=Aliivibrio TaxID=511678 RepID=A0ABY0I4Z2_9GAMM|nr:MULTISPECIES: hypothetical protein [Aliivibrio]ACH63769.1 hypothetical protein VFMJ11_A0674 [Aliivibrio fischeri MJ11]RYU63866.1 hypothetical protein ERW53_11795 [Aliivibrio finisterrensis]RYU82950.1 hypothetical protein ERW52_13840 [Aliivibrio finisterrensis]